MLLWCLVLFILNFEIMSAALKYIEKNCLSTIFILSINIHLGSNIGLNCFSKSTHRMAFCVSRLSLAIGISRLYFTKLESASSVAVYVG